MLVFVCLFLLSYLLNVCRCFVLSVRCLRLNTYYYACHDCFVVYVLSLLFVVLLLLVWLVPLIYMFAFCYYYSFLLD